MRMSFSVSTFYIDFSYQYLQIVPSIATIDFHVLFDQQKWMLIPDEDVVKILGSTLVGRFGHTVDRKLFPEFSVCLLKFSSPLSLSS